MTTVYYYLPSSQYDIPFIISNKMHLNSNDIFSQIGLVVSNQESSSEPLHYYTVYLEIELS